VKKQAKVPPDKHGNIFEMVHRARYYDRKLRQKNRRKK
jgi:hypothetical protein